jgi:hypothetical protein
VFRAKPTFAERHQIAAFGRNGHPTQSSRSENPSESVFYPEVETKVLLILDITIGGRVRDAQSGLALP